jgi:hypothetical protein
MSPNELHVSGSSRSQCTGGGAGHPAFSITDNPCRTGEPNAGSNLSHGHGNFHGIAAFVINEPSRYIAAVSARFVCGLSMANTAWSYEHTVPMLRSAIPKEKVYLSCKTKSKAIYVEVSSILLTSSSIPFDLTDYQTPRYIVL